MMPMLKIYGSMLCPDCIQCREDLDRAGVSYEYLDFSDALINLKEFLQLREGDEFTQVRANGSIGIPCIVTDDGQIHFEWHKFL